MLFVQIPMLQISPIFVYPLTMSFRTPIRTFHKGRHGGPERLSSLSKVMPPANGPTSSTCSAIRRWPSTSLTCMEATWGILFPHRFSFSRPGRACNSAFLPTTWVITRPRTNAPHHAAIITGRNKAWICASESQGGEMMVVWYCSPATKVTSSSQFLQDLPRFSTGSSTSWEIPQCSANGMAVPSLNWFIYHT